MRLDFSALREFLFMFPKGDLLAFELDRALRRGVKTAAFSCMYDLPGVFPGRWAQMCVIAACPFFALFAGERPSLDAAARVLFSEENEFLIGTLYGEPRKNADPVWC